MQVPKLRFKNFHDEWKLKELNNFLTESKIKGDNGKNSKKLSVKLWAKGVVEKKELLEGSTETQYYIRHSGQLVYGKLDFLNCAFGIIPKKLDGYQSTADIPAFDINNINSIFLLNKIIQKNFYKKFGNIANGTRKAKRIHADTFLNMSIYIPSLEEQEEISNFLSLIDKKIELQQKLVSNLNLYKKGLLQKVFFNNSGWKTVKLSIISNILSGKRIPKGMDTVNYNTGIPYITVSSMGNFFVNENNIKYITNDVEKYILKYKVKTNDIIISVAGTLGKINIIQENLCNANLTENCDRITNISKDINYLYLYYYLLVFINKYINSISTKSSQPKLALDKIRDFEVKYPSIEEQNRIAELFSSIDDKISYETKKLENLKTYKKGLLQQMFI